MDNEMEIPEGPRFPDMPQYATAPRQIPNFNLFPANIEYLMAPPFGETSSSNYMVALLFLGLLLLLMSIIN